jgi:hypothetical protein
MGRKGVQPSSKGRGTARTVAEVRENESSHPQECGSGYSKKVLQTEPQAGFRQDRQILCCSLARNVAMGRKQSWCRGSWMPCLSRSG